MQTVLAALTDELRRLKSAGIDSVVVQDESLDALRQAVARRLKGGAKGPTLPAIPSRADTGAAGPPPSSPGLPLPPTVSLPAGDKSDRWAALRELVRADATCRAHLRTGKQVVLGVGNLDAKIMFVGEAPGAEEEIQGEPFVGPAGQLLNRMITGMGLQRSEVYIGNIMNWRPQLTLSSGGVQIGNRPPTREEMAYGLPYLRAQIEIVRPDILVALGATAAQGLLGPGSFRALGEVRGQWREFEGTPLLVTYHPSFILRNPTQRSKRMIWEDFLKIMTRAGLPISERQQSYFLEK